MAKTMEEWTREAEEKRNEERNKLLAIGEEEAKQLSHADQYMRRKYQGEIESAKWLQELQRGLSPPRKADSHPVKKKSFKVITNSNYDRPWKD